MKLNRLGYRILVVVLALLIVSVGGIGFYAMKIAGDNTRRMVNDYEISVANGLAHELDAVFNRFDGILQALSSLVSTRFTPAMLNADVADVVVRQFASQNGKFVADLGAQSVEARSLFMIFNPEIFGVKKVFSVGFQRKDQDSLYMFMDSEQFSAAKLIDRKEPSTSWFWTPLDTGRPYWGDLTRSETGEELVTYTMPVVIGDKIAAVAGMEIQGDAGLLRSLAVRLKDRKKGFGERMTSAVIDRAREQEVRTVYLLTETAERFFDRVGFTVARREDIPAPLMQSSALDRVCPQGSTVLRLFLE